jgi:hypothetical protein
MLLGMRSTLLSSFSPASLFAAGEQGVWYDPSDMTTLFQDSAGTTPVTAVEQPVGLMLDLSKSGVGTNGAKRVNLLTWTEAFNDAAWTKTNSTVTQNAATAPDGTLTADALYTTAATAIFVIGQNHTLGSGSTALIYAQENTTGFLQLSYNGDTTSYANFNLSTGVVGGSGGTATHTIESVGSGWYKCTVVNTSSAVTGIAWGIVGSSSATRRQTFTGTGAESIYIWGADLRLSSEASTAPTPYQRIDASWSATMPGNHATQATPSARPVLSARVNLLTKTEQFDDAAWVKAGASPSTVTANTTVAPNGTTTADTITNSAAPAGEAVYQTITTSVSGASLRYSKRFKRGNHDWVRITAVDDATSTNGFGAWFNLATGAAGTSQVAGTGTLASKSITSLGDSWYLCEVVGTVPATSVRVLNASADADNSFTRVANGTRIVWGADLRVANDTALPVYQRVDTSTSYDTTGFPMYLRFDGSDDAMATASINFTSTDKMTVFGGVRKLSDANAAVVAELSADWFSNGGSFAFTAPNSNAATKYGFALRGSSAAFGEITPYSAPISNVVTQAYDISQSTVATEISVRVNGSSASLGGLSLGTAGTGNFGTYPLFIGSRNQASLRFNGRIYSLVVLGRTATATEITSTEKWISDEMGGGFVP